MFRKYYYNSGKHTAHTRVGKNVMSFCTYFKVKLKLG